MMIAKFPHSRAPYLIKSLTLSFLKQRRDRNEAFNAMLEQELKPRWKVKKNEKN